MTTLWFPFVHLSLCVCLYGSPKPLGSTTMDMIYTTTTNFMLVISKRLLDTLVHIHTYKFSRPASEEIKLNTLYRVEEYSLVLASHPFDDDDNDNVSMKTTMKINSNSGAAAICFKRTEFTLYWAKSFSHKLIFIGTSKLANKINCLFTFSLAR